jgi:aspartyl-tRNA(Asn)/glutamyl-tRNA(Gln) amidotransferase subunit C
MHLADGDLELFQVQLSNILENFRILETLDTAEVKPTRQPNSVTNVTRPDNVVPSMPPIDILANAPQQEDQCFKVRAVLED